MSNRSVQLDCSVTFLPGPYPWAAHPAFAASDAGITRALLAIAPAAAERGGRLPLGSGGVLLLFGVLVTGLLSSAIAMRAAVRGPVLEALRSE